MADLKGINLAMQTPFTASGAIDYATFEALIDKYVAAGVHGLVLGAGTGQHPYLTEAECNRLYETGAKRIGGKCNVICQTSALNMDEVIRRSQHAESIGANALMILPPYLEGPSDEDGIFSFYAEIDAAVGIDIVGYNIPQATGISVSPRLFDRLSGLKNFNYIKDSAGDLTVHQEYLQTKGGVLNGADPTTVYALMAGTRGVIWGAANYMPGEAVQLYELVAAKKFGEALALWKRMLPSLLYIWRAPYTQSVLKAAQWRGYGTGNIRKPLQPMSFEQEAGLRDALKPLFEPSA
ncbi:dihydrodipicolinate synthase family protein [Mesorhizobium sp. M3A.F.Ca.ET.201.01.1.1]|uniref:dihydrodipicolinate synthase family protein n=1 Tax=Mesorhizobium sp. M3A.F.Ca.ET.201.01.1.1 TaxID=2563946 RepID=UPI001093DB3A|nr:dihydrodipicolinate synthase family protein [Mesorhizobium sp. M3A.F.Ca.ET.201.01.1.1]TGS71673.1 dihydrodipicolinate synthase family protein [Mesorhizobium sp. M3A.F.Ca.ET.201.01.1.1]